LGKNHPEVAQNYKTLASSLQEMAEFDNVQSYYERAIAIDSYTYGEDSSEVADDYLLYGILLCEIDRYEMAHGFGKGN
jgi:tetratricopeptide (TPR) repeat protein